MGFKNWLAKYSLARKDLYYKITFIFGLFFIVPVAVIIYFSLKYNIIEDKYIPFFFLILLVFSFIGYRLLKGLVDYIKSISISISKAVESKITSKPLANAKDELGNIVQSFKILENELKHKFFNLEKKTGELATLKELSDLCYITFNPEDLLYITLERALKIVNADVGSVLILKKPNNDYFVVEANIGLDEFGKKGALIKLDESIAKYAVINKSPLLVEDIERDVRFGRTPRPHYSTKSFICMPLKTSNDVIGVITISRKRSEKIFSQEDINTLTPLLSNAAFTYDNLHLIDDVHSLQNIMQSLKRISSSVNSSLNGEELLQTIFQEIKNIIPCDIIALLRIDNYQDKILTLIDFIASIPTDFNPLESFSFKETVFEKIISQQQNMFIDNFADKSYEADSKLFNQNKMNTCMIIPLKSAVKVIGFFMIYNISKQQSEKLSETIETIADHLSVSTERDRLIKSVAKRNQEMESLQLIGSALSSSIFDIEKLLNYTMDMIQAAISVEAGYLLLSDNGSFKFAASFNLDMHQLQNLNIKRGEGIPGYVADSGMIVMTEKVQHHPHYSSLIDDSIGIRTKSILSVPMISQGRVVGVIELINKKDSAFTIDDKQLLQSIAASVSIALENARLYEETLAMAEKERGIRKLFQKFVPHEVVDKIIVGQDTGRPIIEESKIVTLLNIDIRDFSLLSKKIGPKKTVDMLNYFFSIMGDIVFEHKGIVDKYLGDGFLAVFGAPVSSISDAQNATEAALEMQRRLGEVNEYCQNKYKEKLFAGMVVHSGEVVVGNIGFEKKMDYTVIGTAVNFVFRLQELSRKWPNSILLSEATYNEVESILSEKMIKIFEIEENMESIKIYRIDSP
jgi:class 3 adenylate cyclase/GAF domain-containing protein